MNIFWIIILVLFSIVLGLLCLGYFIFVLRETLFIKHLQVGDICRYIIDDYDYKVCDVVEINNNIVKVKDKNNGKIYETHIENITLP